MEQSLTPPPVRDRALALIKRYGWNATSFQALEPGLRYWFAPADDACVAYADTGRAWVAAGAPLGAEERFPEIVAAFLAAAAQARRRACFFGTERRFERLVSLPSLAIGEQPVWNPSEWPSVLRSSRSLREQLRRAAARGVTVRQVRPDELDDPGSPLRAAIQQLVDEWLRGRRMAPLEFLVQVDLFSYREARRILVAERDGAVIGFLAMVPVYARRGWLLEDLLRAPGSPNGTAELLVDHAMRAAAENGGTYATLGLAPLSGNVSRWLRALGAVGTRLYNFEGLRAFKARLRPGSWEPIYLAYPRGQSLLLTLVDAFSAFTPRGLVRFGLETLVRNPRMVLRPLAALLVPWTLLLALAPGHWFPARWVQVAWTGFDLGLLAGLFALIHRWRWPLAVLLAGLITGDALLTLLEVLLYNAPRTTGLLEWTVAVVAVAGPSVTALFLWSAWRYHRGQTEPRDR
ncbi:MAG: hypothetical protein K0Q72_4363 [Armatimonadetes bacterium]|nr:hypothetical protein [Armatimonadota bacterium]